MNQTRIGNTSNDKEMLTMAEEELARLQRQLRIMEEDRMAFLEETGSKLRKQRTIIGRLRKEKEKIYEEINVATCLNQKRNDEKLIKKMSKLLEDYERYDKLVRKEKEELRELEIQIKKMEADSQRLRPKSVITDQDYENRLKMGEQSIQILKDRLENAVKKFCGILTKNKELREEIDHLLKERAGYNIIWESLLKEMQNRKKYMVELIEQASVAFDQREEWCTKLAALKKRAQSDYLAHTEEMREIQRKLDHDVTLREFLSVKGQKRILKDLEEKERKKRDLQTQNQQNQLIMLENTMKQIQTFCGENDVNKMASLYLKQEEENFALFNYVNELNHEIDLLQVTLNEIQAKIDEQIEISQSKEKERMHNLEFLRKQLEAAIKEANDSEENVKKVEFKLKSILEGIEEIFDLLSCDRGPILGLLGK
ncbi:coiled-coil domain-containing protein 63-like [Diorhabda sublineata]|uniref:coiled-coil domain-containing protein 63-like n=1 Tax=Diorhabda sublineata TaxID=1163346 RepID=UPI0024E14F81|nr:coiled-coil domain-containing protein 63-like [Diorhabda sublineata]